MSRRRLARSAASAVLVAGLGTLPLGGCALLQPPPVPPVPRVPHLGVRGSPGDASCGADVARAHAALADAGAAAGDPAATAAAHASAAAAMHAYHVCLARSTTP